MYVFFLDIISKIETQIVFHVQGKEVVSLLGASKPGQWTGAALALVSEWALDHPEGTKEECASWLKEQHAAGKVDTGGNSDSAPPAKKAKVASK